MARRSEFSLQRDARKRIGVAGSVCIGQLEGNFAWRISRDVVASYLGAKLECRGGKEREGKEVPKYRPSAGGPDGVRSAG